jgi:IS30 family transposase
LIEGKRSTKQNLLTMYERKTKMGIAIKIKGKKQQMLIMP